jgi:resuscitation-promoting factor RpfB
VQDRYNRYRFLARRRMRKTAKKFERHPYVIPPLIVGAILLIAAGLFISVNGQTNAPDDTNIVLLYADRKSRSLPTREETVGAFLEKAGVEINDGDVVEPGLDAKIEEDNFRINVYRAAPVVVIDGGEKLYGLSAAMTPRTMAEQIGAKLYPEDRAVTEPSDDFLKDGGIGNKVVIERAVPAHLNLYGTPLVLRTHAKTVGDLLKEKNVQLAPEDTVKPSLETPLTSDMQVFVVRNGIQVVTTEETVAAPSETVQDSSLSFGTIVVRQPGQPGKKSVTYQIDVQNGVEVGRKVIQEIITLQPVTEVVAKGQAVQIPSDKESIMRAAGIAADDFQYVYFIINHENAMWCPTRWQGQSFCPPYYQEKFPGSETHTSTGYGLCQSTPAIKMASAGEDWRTNVVTQMKWCHGYAIGRYGTWQAAYESWVRNRWW